MDNSSVYIVDLDLIRPDDVFKATLCCCFFSDKTDYEGVIQYLHSKERNYYNTLKFEKRIRSYLMGRFVAKKAVAALTGNEKLTSISIESGIFTQPIVVLNKHSIQVSITHCDDFGAALAFPEAHPMGIDIEKISIHNRSVLEGQISADERGRISSCSFSYETGLTLLWTAKEALSKVLKTGLMTPFDVFEVSKIECYDNYITCYFKNFAQYKVISFSIGNYMCSIVHPLKTRLHFNIHALKLNFGFIKALNDETEFNYKSYNLL